jgi:hypothetical protein
MDRPGRFQDFFESSEINHSPAMIPLPWRANSRGRAPLLHKENMEKSAVGLTNHQFITASTWMLTLDKIDKPSDSPAIEKKVLNITTEI